MTQWLEYPDDYTPKHPGGLYVRGDGPSRLERFCDWICDDEPWWMRAMVLIPVAVVLYLFVLVAGMVLR